MRTFQVGQTIYHGWRYWKSEGLEPGEVLGWNTLYLPYRITKITAARIHVEHKDVRIQLNRETMERDGKQYHSRFHEYFYAKKPEPESREWNWAGNKPNFVIPNFTGDCLATLGLSTPYTKAVVVHFRCGCPINFSLSRHYDKLKLIGHQTDPSPTKADVRRAYKRLAKAAHPDLGGSHQQFIKLKQAHDSALRFAKC